MPETKNAAGKGYWGKILHVDLTTGSVSPEFLDDSFYQKYLGGIGIAAKVLWDRLKPGIDPLGPENILGFTTGLLTDTGSLFTGRFTVVGKSPASGGWGDANCGGYFSPALKRCGVDAVFFSGKSLKPVYLYLDHEKAELKDASDLRGLDTIETEDLLRERHGKRAQVACIGPAGEKRSLLAGISTDRGRLAARCGLGAVMGSKNLKAVVAAGTQRVGVMDKAAIREISSAFRKRLDKGAFFERFLGDRLFAIVGRMTRPGFFYMRQPALLWRKMLKKFGTPSLTVLSAEGGDSPIKNWGGVGYRDFPLERSENIGAETVIRFEEKKYGCYSCPLRCGGIVSIKQGPHIIEEMHKPEYETLCAFGSLLLNDDLLSICRINDLVNRAGMDSISCGATVAFAIECYESGILSKVDTDGLDLRWGNSDAITGLVEKILRREGLGDILADGVKRAAEKIGRGSEKFAVHCGGVEAPMHDPKFDPGFLISYFCEPTPGRHTISSYQYLDLQELHKKFSRARKTAAVTSRKKRFNPKDKGEMLAVDSFYKMLVDCAGACFFGTQVGAELPLCEWMNAATGWNLPPDAYLVAAERVHKLRHSFNVREGLNPIRDFRPHPRLYGDPPQDKGPARKVTIDIDTLAESYYKAMHWELQTGKPHRKRLEELGLPDVLQEFYPPDAQ
ncbi:MAG: aldehyde ferredoxin oxidoreductase family protein [Deltaproteobacteria bacterium]|nr:aldehyde ferredoxin oxidoreductase family protein [Deltaproteobacteria bacterium]